MRIECKDCTKRWFTYRCLIFEYKELHEHLKLFHKKGTAQLQYLLEIYI